jgi:deoxyhypusine synthase
MIVEESYGELNTHCHVGAGFQTVQALSGGGLTGLFNHCAYQCHVVAHGEVGAQIAKSGIEYMAAFYDEYQVLSEGAGVGFFQIGGGIAGDFPICVVPSIKYDLEQSVKPWAYFCQISDSTTSYGSYSGATPNEKITWDKLTEDTPMFVIESDATIVVPLMLQALLECKRNPEAANALIARYGR